MKANIETEGTIRIGGRKLTVGIEAGHYPAEEPIILKVAIMQIIKERAIKKGIKWFSLLSAIYPLELQIWTFKVIIYVEFE